MATAKRTLTFYSDPGHAWLRVPRALVQESGAEISGYSYQRGRWVYLEEDSDVGAFVKAIGGLDAFRERYDLREVDSQRDSAVRRYQPYQPEAAA